MMAVTWARETKKLLPSNKRYEPTHTPTVLKRNGKYHMWFCYRGVEDFRNGENSYRMGYAWSEDLREWFREDDKAGINVSADGWDSKMTAYPYVATTPDEVLLFYNGNGFGASGFGYAVLV